MFHRLRRQTLLLGLAWVLLSLHFAGIDVAQVVAACPVFPTTVPAADSTRLIEVINCANATVANDVINLTNSTYTLTTVNASDTGLPPIASTALAGTLTINGNGATITRSTPGGTFSFRLFSVNTGATLTLNKVRLTNGSTFAIGGAIYNQGMLTLFDSTISGNAAGDGGGAIYNGSGTVTLNRSTLSGNTASFGGAIVNADGTLRIINSTLSGNSAVGSGGGAFNSYGASISPSVVMINSTITGNTAVQATRSGLWLQAGTLTIQNSIVANNNGANNCVVTSSTLTDGGNNLSNGTSCAFGGAVGQNTNPLLGVLANNGGNTQTHALLTSSPAINAGNNAKALDAGGAPLTTDQRGTNFPRIVGGTVDIGAVEGCPTFPTTVPAGNSAQLIEAISCANATVTNDVINLTNSTYTLTTVNANETGLPPIVGVTTAGTLTINGNGATITRSAAGGTPSFRLFYVNTTANLEFNNVRLTNGSVPSSSGGAIYVTGFSILRIFKSTLSGNTAVSGGAIFISSGGVNLNSTTLSSNTASDFGGAIASDSGTMFIVNSTLSGNTAAGITSSGGGGAVASDGREPLVVLINSTLTNNTAVAPNVLRSGLFLKAARFVIQNSIVANNNGDNNCAVALSSITDNGNNLSNGASCPFGGVVGQNTNPQLSALANNGGSTQTHALLPGSPAINTGNNANAVDAVAVGMALTTDQRGTGFPRIVGGTVDIGAYEADIEIGSLNVQLTLQGRANPAPHPSRVVTVNVQIKPQGGGTTFYNQNFTTDSSSAFSIPSTPTGTYLFTFKGTHTLARQQTITIDSGVNLTTTPVLLEGDANGSNHVNITDFSLLATAFGKTNAQVGYNVLTDFNNDGIVNISDFSLLATNFNQIGAGGVIP